VAALTGLTSLKLADNQIGDAGACALASLTQLDWLNLSGNRIGDAGARALSALVDVRILELERNQIGQDGIRALLASWGDARTSALCLHDNPGTWMLTLPRSVSNASEAQLLLEALRRLG
jgi:hypothetical protein